MGEIQSLYQELARIERQGESAALCTIVQSHGSTPRHTGSKMLVYTGGRFTGTVGGGEIESRVIAEALAAMKDGRPRSLSYNMVDPKAGDPGVCGGTVEVYIEPVVPQATILIVGGGHVGRAVAHLARWLNFRVAVSDDRVEFCTPEANPDAHEFFPVPMQDLPAQAGINAQTYVILTTRGVAVDIAGLPALLETPAAYIGIIGSKRRWLTTRRALEEAGIPEEKLNRIVSPMGLELNAETPEEIAVSILAEILMLRNGGSGEPMRLAQNNTPSTASS